METEIIKITKEFVRELLPKRVLNSNKGTYGSVLNIAGCLNYPGAAMLSSISALKVGAGKVTLGTTSSVIPIVASNYPEVTFINLGENDFFGIPKDGIKYFPKDMNYSAISIGCGLGLLGGTKEFALSFLDKNQESNTPIIIDADGINALSSSNFKKELPLNSIITPHPLELSRLLKVSVTEIQSDRISYAIMASKQFDCIVLLKGYETVIAIPNGRVFINTTGNSALAKAGTGDVLTGMIAGFSAQGLKLEDATCLAAYLHGLSGEIASFRHSEYSVLASNVIESIPIAIKEIMEF